MSFVWEHDEANDSEYWKELTTLHGLIRYGVYGELILSCVIIGDFWLDYLLFLLVL